MKIYRMKISNIKELEKTSEISKILNFYDISTPTSNTIAQSCIVLHKLS